MPNIEDLKKAAENPKTPKELCWLMEALEGLYESIGDVEEILNSHGNPNFKFSLQIRKSFNNSHYLTLNSVSGGLSSSVPFNQASPGKAANEFFERLREIEDKYGKLKEENEEEDVGGLKVLETLSKTNEFFEQLQEIEGKYEKLSEENGNEEEWEYEMEEEEDEGSLEVLENLSKTNELYDDFNEEQKKAIFSDLKPQCVIAGAGSGKTRVLVNRFYYLITEKNIKPNRILVITFTRKSAAEIKQRIIKKTGLTERGLQYISTFHSFFLKVLRRDLWKINSDYKKFKIIAEEARRILIRNAYMREYGWDADDDEIKAIDLLMTRYWQERSEEEIERYSEKLGIDEEILKKIIDSYGESLEILKSLDYDGFETKVNELFENMEEIREKWSKRFDAILIDEFQDTSVLQFEAIKKITDLNSNIFVVGDPDQSIYGFRSSMPKSFNAYMEHFQIDAPLKLQQNFRSTKNILEISNLLIKKNPRDERMRNELWTENEEGKKVIYEWSPGDRKQEMFLVAKRVAELIKEENLDQNDVAILYRSRLNSENHYIFTSKLNEYGIEYKTRNLKEYFLRSPEIIFIMALLHLVVLDDPSFCYLHDVLYNILDFSKILPEIKQEEIWIFSDWAKSNSKTFTEALENSSSIPINEKALRLLRGLKNNVDRWREECETMSLDLWLTFFLDTEKRRLKIFEHLFMWRYRNIYILKRILRRRSEELLSKEEIVKNLIFEDISSFELEEEKSAVFLDTVHQSKGLEWKYVFLMKLDNSYACSYGGKIIDYEEERRIAYVAFTRAQKELFLIGRINKPEQECYLMDEEIKNSPALEIKMPDLSNA